MQNCFSHLIEVKFCKHTGPGAQLLAQVAAASQQQHSDSETCKQLQDTKITLHKIRGVLLGVDGTTCTAQPSSTPRTRVQLAKVFQTSSCVKAPCPSCATCTQKEIRRETI
eukprot:1149665-Pelagomonas_calceolata.AAC.9